MTQAEYMAGVKKLYADANIKPWMMPLQMGLQIPIFTSFYFAFTAICTHSLPSMVAESAAFGMNLTTVDPHHYWPCVTVLSMMAPVRYLSRPCVCLFTSLQAVNV